MKHVWTILCEKSIIDSQTNLLSLLNCVEEINLAMKESKFQENNNRLIPVNLELISLWSIDDYTKENINEIKIELKNPQNIIIGNENLLLKAKKGKKRLRNKININEIPVNKEGRYIFKILQKRNNKYITVSEIPLDITILFSKD
ncbi:hypothetical protein K9M50_02920 [Patescibacteria group bacterium]|nr:hypothetical protein [Patescibacteria group bacterium]